MMILLLIKGEELRKQIGAPCYIECSSKTQEVYNFRCCYSFRVFIVLPMDIFQFSYKFVMCRTLRQYSTQLLRWHFSRRIERKRRRKHRRDAPSCDQMSTQIVLRFYCLVYINSSCNTWKHIWKMILFLFLLFLWFVVLVHVSSDDLLSCCGENLARISFPYTRIVI